MMDVSVNHSYISIYHIVSLFLSLRIHFLPTMTSMWCIIFVAVNLVAEDERITEENKMR